MYPGSRDQTVQMPALHMFLVDFSCSSCSLVYVCNIGFTADNNSAAFTKPEARSIFCGSGGVLCSAAGEPDIGTTLPTYAIARQRAAIDDGLFNNNTASWICCLTGSVRHSTNQVLVQPSC